MLPFERESQRIAHAFGVEVFQLTTAGLIYHYAGLSHGTSVVWELDWFAGRLHALTIAQGSHHCSVFHNTAGWCCSSDKLLDAQMVEGLSQMGFEDHTLLDELRH